MNDEAGFIQAMQEHPDDATLRLVFADWLEEHSDPRCELVRLLYTLTQTVEIPDRSKLEDRLRCLLESGVQSVGPFWTNSIGMKFGWIPAGMFLMGSSTEEEGRYLELQHKVTLTKGFYLAIHPVTQEQWFGVMGNNPSHFRGEANLPVEQISWRDCKDFFRKLSEREGLAYRLPTEAEWEYACRAGTTTPFYFGDAISTDQANFNGNHPYRDSKKGLNRGRTTPVGSFPPNGWGLHDMHGNVWEWCADWGIEKYQSDDVVDPQGPKKGDSRVVRGGSFVDQASLLRSARRHDLKPAFRALQVGFRPVRTFSP